MVQLGQRYFVMGGASDKIEEFDVNSRSFTPVSVDLLSGNSGGFAGVIEVPTKYFASLPNGCGGVNPPAAAVPPP